MKELLEFSENGVRAQQAVDAISKPEEKLAAINPTPHLNRAAVRAYALEMAAKLRRFHKFERVSGDFLLRIENATRQAIVSEVKRHPSKGKTLL